MERNGTQGAGNSILRYSCTERLESERRYGTFECSHIVIVWRHIFYILIDSHLCDDCLLLLNALLLSLYKNRSVKAWRDIEKKE